MSVVLEAVAPPIRQDASGALRVGESRVLLELVVRAFQDGATPEAIVQRYPSVTLADSYAVVAHYLRNRKSVDDYLDERERLAVEVQRRVSPPAGDLTEIRDRLKVARKA